MPLHALARAAQDIKSSLVQRYPLIQCRTNNVIPKPWVVDETGTRLGLGFSQLVEF